MEMRPCKLSDIVKHNPLFARQTWFSQDRDAFFHDFIAAPEKAIGRWTVPPSTFKPSLKRRLINLLPTSLLRFVSKMHHFVRH